ncbi:MAG: hypothetical protein E6G67_01200 [Actinobacteria bacterium]|nr:MAG: hypothetical protein E6G67_01200 [Actinomycetota bacterium]
MIDAARYQWEEGRRRLESESRDAARARQLADLLEAVQDELRRRIGQRFTLAELARAYEGSEEWVRDVVIRMTHPRARAGIRDTTLVQDAAFAQYARGATDYRP